MRRWAFAMLLLASALAGTTPSQANFLVSGTFKYRDREFGPAGFTGAEPNKPIRLADVEVLDALTLGVLARGATDLQGHFSLQVTDSQTRDIKVRVKTSSANTPDLHLVVKVTPQSQGGNAIYAVSRPTQASHAPTQDINFDSTPVVAVADSGGDAFNIYDVLLDGLDFIAAVNSSARPSVLLTAYWAKGTGVGTYFLDSSKSIYLVGLSNDSDGYDDTVISHEEGHFTEFTLAKSDNTGGQHTLNDYFDLSLTWSEGWATYFNNMVRDWKGLDRPEIYVDTSGQPGQGHTLISYQLENPVPGVIGQLGANNEVSVNCVLWDIHDRVSTHDASLGVDDDPLDVPNGNALFWKVFRQYLPITSTVSLEDFWDGWFSPSIANGFATEMRSIFAARGVEYFADSFESDNSKAQAPLVVANAAPKHHTFYPVNDQDWAQINAVLGGQYTFETQNLMSGADTKLELRASDGVTLLAVSDDRSTGDVSSEIQWTAPSTGVVYLRCTRKADGHTYGSYDLSVTGLLPVEVSDVETSATPAGIQLRWRGQRRGLFSHFDVQRAGAVDGPYSRRNTAPIEAAAAVDAAYAFLDRDVEAGRSYFYRLVGLDANGESQLFGPYAATAAVPARVALQPLRPNPFNPSTSFGIELPRAGRAWVRVFSADGRLVRVLSHGEALAAGSHSFQWDGRDERGSGLPSGIYLVQLEALGHRQMQRAVLVR